MILTCSATSQIPSGTANSIQVMMACDGLRRCGEDICLYIPGQGSIDFEPIRDRYGLHCEAFPIRGLTSRPSLHRLDFTHNVLKAGRKDGVRVHYTWVIQIAAMAALRGVETAYEIHDLPVGGGVRWFDLYTRTAAPKKVLCITRALRDELLNRFPRLREEDCLITPNGFSPEDYAGLPDLTEAKRQMGFSPERPAVSCSGHLYAGRGSELFLQLASRFPEADFHWFGGTEEAVADHQKTAEERGLSNVTFHGFFPKNRLPLAQAACDIQLMPYEKHIAGSGGGDSAKICSPMKMFEYMAGRRCILTSDLPVIHEVLDESCALFCIPEDADSWEAGLRKALNDTGFRESLAREAGNRSSAYTWQKRAETYLNGRTHG